MPKEKQVYKFEELLEFVESVEEKEEKPEGLNVSNIDIKESFYDDDDNEVLKVDIEAIHEIVTANSHSYTADELKGNYKKKTGTFSWTYPYEKPVLTHHNSRSGEPIGRVVEASYSDTSLAGPPVIKLRAEITDPDAIKKVKDGRYETVSIGGYAEHVYCSICGQDWIDEGSCEHFPGRKYGDDDEVAELIMADLTFVEVSFVNIPADEYAGVTRIINDDETDNLSSENLKSYESEVTSETITQGGKVMTLEELKAKNTQLEESVSVKEEKTEVLETKVGNLEAKNEALESEKAHLEEKVETLELSKENLSDEIAVLTEANNELKAKQHGILAEKVVSKKIEMGRLAEEAREEAVENHIQRTEESLNDTLTDLKAEAEMAEEEAEEEVVEEEEEEVTEPAEEQASPGLVNDENVEVEEEDEEDEDFSEALKELMSK